MTIVELIEQYRRESKDTALPYYTSDDDLVLLFNDAIDEACQRRNLIFDKTTPDVCVIDVTSGTATYDLDAAVNFINTAYLVSESGEFVYLTLKSRDYLDNNTKYWREETGDPHTLIVDENSIEIHPAPAAVYTLKLEVYRCPLSAERIQSDSSGTPAIAEAHHRKLYHWPMYLVHGMQDDEDAYNPARSERHLKEFEKYFGKAPTADRKRSTKEDRPHCNKLW